MRKRSLSNRSLFSELLPNFRSSSISSLYAASGTNGADKNKNSSNKSKRGNNSSSNRGNNGERDTINSGTTSEIETKKKPTKKVVKKSKPQSMKGKNSKPKFGINSQNQDSPILESAKNSPSSVNSKRPDWVTPTYQPIYDSRTGRLHNSLHFEPKSIDVMGHPLSRYGVTTLNLIKAVQLLPRYLQYRESSTSKIFTPSFLRRYFSSVTEILSVYFSILSLRKLHEYYLNLGNDPHELQMKGFLTQLFDKEIDVTSDEFITRFRIFTNALDNYGYMPPVLVDMIREEFSIRDAVANGRDILIIPCPMVSLFTVAGSPTLASNGELADYITSVGAFFDKVKFVREMFPDILCSFNSTSVQPHRLLNYLDQLVSRMSLSCDAGVTEFFALKSLLNTAVPSWSLRGKIGLSIESSLDFKKVDAPFILSRINKSFPLPSVPSVNTDSYNFYVNQSVRTGLIESGRSLFPEVYYNGDKSRNIPIMSDPIPCSISDNFIADTLTASRQYDAQAFWAHLRNGFEITTKDLLYYTIGVHVKKGEDYRSYTSSSGEIDTDLYLFLSTSKHWIEPGMVYQDNNIRGISYSRPFTGTLELAVPSSLTSESMARELARSIGFFKTYVYINEGESLKSLYLTDASLTPFIASWNIPLSQMDEIAEKIWKDDKLWGLYVSSKSADATARNYRQTRDLPSYSDIE